MIVKYFETVASQTCAMEAENHFKDHGLLSVAEVKNGVSPKSQTSKGNLKNKCLCNYRKEIYLSNAIF